MKSALPPGPNSIVMQTYRFLRDPYTHLSNARAKFGDPFTLRTLMGPMLVTGDPAGARAIFGADPSIFDVFSPGILTPFLGAESLILISGDKHKRDRKLLTPPFHGARMRAYGAIIADVAHRELSKWRFGEEFPIHEATQSISLDVIIRAVFGVTEPARAERFRHGVMEAVEAIDPLFVFMRFLRQEFGGFGPWARYQRTLRRFENLLDTEIKERRAAKSEGSDILSLMLAARYDDGESMADDTVRDELRTLLLAGHETTATALAWSMYWLHRDRPILNKLLAEIDSAGPSATPEAIAALPYLDAVCNETLRLYPIVSDVTRLLREPLEVQGYTVPAGTAVAVAISLIHEREDLYPDASRFRPERFLERKFTPFEYMPFGGGARRCLGAAFASYEMKIVLCTILREYRFRLANNDVVKPMRRNITMGPRHGVPMVIEGLRTVRRFEQAEAVTAG